MTVLEDIWKRTFYLSFFVVLLPIGAYSIHNGSSATVALASYLVLSFLMPIFYLSSSRSGFGPHEKRIGRGCYALSWGLVQFVTYQLVMLVEAGFLWGWPTIGRDIVFLVWMLCQLYIMLTIAYGIASLKSN